MSTQVRCPRCATLNTVDDAARADSARCRECRAPLPVPSSDVAVTARPIPVPPPLPGRRGRADDADDRPAPPRPARRPSGAGGLWMVLACGGVLAVAALVLVFGSAGLYFLLRGHPAAGPDVAPAGAPAGAPDGPVAQVPVQAPLPPPAEAPPPAVVAPAMEGAIPIPVLEAIKDATVFVKTDGGPLAGSGSGFLMHADGDTAYFATNDHVVHPQAVKGAAFARLAPQLGAAAPAMPVTVVLRSGTPREQVLTAEAVADDPEADLAVLRARGARDLPRPIDFRQQVDLVETMPLYIFGFPFGKALAIHKGNPAITVGKGSISSLRRDERGELTRVQVNGDLNPGNSGGPVVDAQGRLIGVSAASIKGTQIGMAIPAAELTQLLAGRALAAAVFKKAVGGNFAETHGEQWLMDRNHHVRSNRSFVDRKPNAAPGGEAGAFEVEVRLLDPLRRIAGVTLLVVRTDPAAPARPNAQGRWGPLPGAGQVRLKLDGQRAFGSMSLPPGAQPHESFSFQLALLNAAGQAVYTQPHAFRLTFNPGAVAVAPPPAPANPLPPALPVVPPAPRPGGVADGPTQIMGGAFDPPFRDEAPDGGVLVGLDVGLGKFINNDIIIAARPIYRTGKGEVAGGTYGTDFSRPVSVRAKPGYAIGAMTAKSGLTIDGFSVTFMRITPKGLDPADAYQSEWLGGRGGGPETLLGGTGTPVVGIVGKANRDGRCTGLGLLLKRGAAPPAGGGAALTPRRHTTSHTITCARPAAPRYIATSAGHQSRT